MSHEFWLGVLVTVVIGIPGAYAMAILANMHTPKLVHFLESRKLLKKHRTRQQALVVFNRIRSFHDGSRDRYAHFILLAVGSVLSGLVATTFFTVFFTHVTDVLIPIDYAIFLLLAVFSTLIAVILLSAIYETARQLDRFEDYKAEFERRWGSVDKEHP